MFFKKCAAFFEKHQSIKSATRAAPVTQIDNFVVFIKNPQHFL
jgi:hypothetical protein